MLPRLELVPSYLDLIQKVGFPIFVAVWLLYQGNRQHEANLENMSRMRDELAKLTEALRTLTLFVQQQSSRSKRKER